MYLSDIHTHSIASGHGTTCTISDMAKAASKKGLKLLGISDHGPGTLASGTSSYFRSLPFYPRKRFGIDILYGVELNILDSAGHTDLSDELLNNLDYAIISMHRQNYRSGSVSQNTEAYINAMKHPAVKILGHCDDTHFPVRANAARILYLCQKYQLPVILSSDSHGKEHVGDFTYAEEFVHQLMFPETLILNNQLPKLKVFLQTR